MQAFPLQLGPGRPWQLERRCKISSVTGCHASTRRGAFDNYSWQLCNRKHEIVGIWDVRLLRVDEMCLECSEYNFTAFSYCPALKSISHCTSRDADNNSIINVIFVAMLRSLSHIINYS